MVPPDMSNHIFAYSVIDKPDIWLTVIAPDATLKDVHATLLQQFGDRLVGMREHAGGMGRGKGSGRQHDSRRAAGRVNHG
jgi:hypothetical protein